jgi:hypothetical protein
MNPTFILFHDEIWFYLSANMDLLQIWTFRITGTGMQKMPCYSTKYHYMKLMVVCGNLWVQLGLLGSFFPPRSQIHTDILHKFWYKFQTNIQLQDCLCHSSERQCNGLQCKQFTAGDIIIRRGLWFPLSLLHSWVSKRQMFTVIL